MELLHHLRIRNVAVAFHKAHVAFVLVKTYFTDAILL